MYRLTVNNNVIGKDSHAIARNHNNWQEATLNLKELFTWNYTHGKAIAPSTFDNNVKENTHWNGSQLIVIDIDGQGADVLNRMLSSDFVRSHCAMAYPSSSFTPVEDERYHFFFPLSERVQVVDFYRYLYTHIVDLLPVPSDRSMKKPAQALYGTVYTHPTMQGVSKDVQSKYVHYNEGFTPLNVIALLPSFLDVKEAGELDHSERAQRDNSGEMSKRAELHEEQPIDKRLTVVLDALSFALKDWGHKDYDEWLALWMSAYSGADGDTRVLDYIVSHDDVQWSSNSDIRKFKSTWVQHTQRDGNGYTVATLFLMARRNGWLAESSQEIPTKCTTSFTNSRVSDWFNNLPAIPQHALIQSSLGSGKTMMSIDLYKRLARNDVDIKAVYLAPSVKLCLSLSATLTQNGVSNTVYIDDGKTKDVDTLVNARVLVTTLQTFAVKVVQAGGVDIAEYGLVVIDESDELISAFVRANTGRTVGYASHVTQRQSVVGYETLARIFQYVPYVYMLDGTATMVSYTLAKQHSPKHRNFTVYRNEWVQEKSDVLMLASIHDARKIILDNVNDGGRVVIATGTKREANLITWMLLTDGACTPDELITITGSKGNDARVNEFFKDVNAGASKYRVVIYNSAMGSGVSITDVRPNAFIQIADYVQPRKHLQIVNRYRQTFPTYCYINPTENLYGEGVQDKLDRVDAVVSREHSLTGVSYVERADYADKITDLAMLSIRDEYDQRRSPYTFYSNLLVKDGRKVEHLSYNEGDIKDVVKKARDVLAVQRELVMSTWREVEPFSRDTSIDGLSDVDVARSILHAHILRMFNNVDNVTYDDTYIAELSRQFGRYYYNIDRVMNPNDSINTTIQESIDSKRAKITLKMWVSRLELMAQVGYILPSTDTVTDLSTLDANVFVDAVQERKHVYDLSVGVYRNRFNQIMARKQGSVNDAGVSMATYLLGTLGIKLRRKNGKRDTEGKRSRVLHVANVNELRDFMELRGYRDNVINFVPDEWDTRVKDLRKLARDYETLNGSAKLRVLEDMQEMGTGFTDAIGLVGRDLF